MLPVSNKDNIFVVDQGGGEPGPANLQKLDAKLEGGSPFAKGDLHITVLDAQQQINDVILPRGYPGNGGEVHIEGDSVQTSKINGEPHRVFSIAVADGGANLSNYSVTEIRPPQDQTPEKYDWTRGRRQ